MTSISENRWFHVADCLPIFIRTNADKANFVRRNRIVADMSDACILMESVAYSGGLITARLSSDCNHDVFAFPGAVGRNTAKIATI